MYMYILLYISLYDVLDLIHTTFIIARYFSDEKIKLVLQYADVQVKPHRIT